MLWGNNVAAPNICPGLYLFNQGGVIIHFLSG